MHALPPLALALTPTASCAFWCAQPPSPVLSPTVGSRPASQARLAFSGPARPASAGGNKAAGIMSLPRLAMTQGSSAPCARPQSAHVRNTSLGSVELLTKEFRKWQSPAAAAARSAAAAGRASVPAPAHGNGTTHSLADASQVSDYLKRSAGGGKAASASQNPRSGPASSAGARGSGEAVGTTPAVVPLPVIKLH